MHHPTLPKHRSFAQFAASLLCRLHPFVVPWDEPTLWLWVMGSSHRGVLLLRHWLGRFFSYLSCAVGTAVSQEFVHGSPLLEFLLLFSSPYSISCGFRHRGIKLKDFIPWDDTNDPRRNICILYGWFWCLNSRHVWFWCVHVTCVKLFADVCNICCFSVLLRTKETVMLHALVIIHVCCGFSSCHRSCWGGGVAGRGSRRSLQRWTSKRCPGSLGIWAGANFNMSLTNASSGNSWLVRLYNPSRPKLSIECHIAYFA